MKRLLFVSSMALFPETRFGGSKRLYWIAKALAKTHEVTVIWMDGCREAPDGADPVSGHFQRSLRIPMPASRTWFRKLFFPDVDQTQAYRIEESLQADIFAGSFEAALFAYPLSLSVGGKWMASIPNRFYLEDDFLLESYPRQSPSWVNRWIAVWKFRRLFFWQRARLRNFHKLFAISQEEGSIAAQYFPWLPVRMLPYAIPLSDYPLLGPAADPGVLGFIGNYAHSPNLDALHWLIEEIFPVIRREFGSARLVLAGASLPEGHKKRWEKIEGIEFCGEIADLHSFYEKIAIFINPIRTGRGMRTKIIEAAAFGRPILTTALGAEGADGLWMEFAESTEDFLKAYRKILAEGDLPQKILSNRKILEARHDLDSAGDIIRGEFSP